MQFNTSDVDRYWRAYEAGGRLGQRDAFQRVYLDSASAPLREFMGLRSVTAASLATVANVAPRYLATLRTWWPTVTPSDPVFAEIRGNFGRLKAQYPDAFFPPVTLLMGRYSTGGTVGKSGIFVGVEFFGADRQAPVDELSPFARDNVMSWSRDLPRLVAHEHVHVLQSAVGGTNTIGSGTLLRRSLSEGIAEFVGALSSGAPLFQRFYVTWQAREREYWLAFDRERSGTDVSRWLYNQGQTSADWPGDLGYFMGYRIAQAYYMNATDKTQALRDLLAMKDPDGILARSRYAGNGPVIEAIR